MDPKPAQEKPQGAVVVRKRPNAAMPMLREKAPMTPYGLRQGSKLPSRYRDEELAPNLSPSRTRSPKYKSPKKTATPNPNPVASSARRVIAREEPMKAIKSEVEDTGYPDDFMERNPLFVPTRGSQTPQIGSQSSSCSSTSLYEANSDIPSVLENYDLIERSGMHASSSQSSFHSMSGRKLTKHERDREALGERLGTKRLEHTLSLHKARRWTICEFFYSSIDEQLFLAENEFVNIVKEAFPNLKTTNLNKQQWRTVRRLLGKARRCSPLFFLEEREALEQRRAKIRAIYDGSLLSHAGYDVSDLPQKIPRPLVVGNRVYARIHNPKDGIYSGTIDAVLKNGYRIIFEKEDMIPPLEVNDTEVMLDGSLELVPLSYFIEQVSAKLPFGIPRAPPPVQDRREQFSLSPAKVIKKETDAEGDKVGNFPVRMLVILVKLSKLIDLKKKMVKQLAELNAEAQKANLLTDTYHPNFQEKYAQVVVDLENVNKQMGIYMQGVQDYSGQLNTKITDNHTSLRPENIRKTCTAQAQTVIRHCNKGLNVKDPRALSLITSLTSLLLQIRNLGQNKITPVDLQSLSDAMTEIRSKISSKSAAAFQDHVEVHMKQIHLMMLQCGALSNRMDYGEEGSFDQLFSSLTPEMTRDTWIEAAVGGDTVSGGTSGGNTPFEDLVTSGDIQYFTNDESPDIFMGTDEDIDRAVQKMFERPAKKVDNGDVELPLRTPSPPGMVYTQMTNMSSQSLQPPIAEEYTQNLRVPSTPLGCTPMTPYRPPQQTFPNTQPFPSSAMISGCNVGYTTTTFSPVPIPHNGEAPPSFGFYAPLPMPNDTIANSSSFSGSLSANANGLFAHSTRTTTVTTTARPNVATDVTTVNGEKLTPSATPRTLTGRTMSFSGRSATTPFYQPTIRKMKEIRPPKGSIEERSPMITALLKSQSQLFSQKNVPKPLIFAIKKQPKQIKKAAKQGKGVVKTGAPLPSRSISAGNPPLPDPTVITLDGASDQEELIEEEDPPLLTAQNNKGTAARNPSVLVFPNMRDFTLLGTKNSHQPRPQLCIQSRTIIGRVLAYNTEVRRRMGSGYVGPWLSPVKLTSYMTGISTSLVKQCEEFGKIRLVSCQAPEGKKPVPRNTVVIGPATPQKNKPVNQVVPPVRAIAPPSRFPIRPPFITNHSSVFAPVRPPMLMGQKLEFDWSSLYNGKPTPDKLMSRKRTQTVCGLLREEPVEKKARLPGELPKVVSPEDEAILRILRENGFDVSGPGQSEDSEIRGLVDELLDAVCYEEERMNEAIQIEDESLAEGFENAAIPPKRITRFSSATPLRIPVRGRNKPFVPTIAEEPFMFRGKMHRDRRDANYNFRPRECIAKKRFTY